MIFGKIDAKIAILLIIISFLALFTTVSISQVEMINPGSILLENGFTKAKIKGFNCYKREVYKVHDNLHGLSYIQYITDQQVQQGDIQNYLIAIEIKCINKDSTSHIIDKQIDKDHHYCDDCHRKLGNNLINVFNTKDGIKIQDIKTNQGWLHVFKISLGLLSLVCLLTVIFINMSSAYINLKNNETTLNLLVTKTYVTYKGYVIAYLVLFLCSFILFI